MNLKGKNFLKLLDFTPEEIQGFLDLAADLRQKRRPVFRTTRCAVRTLR
jgi:ornithine carbamoyltransferase